MSIASHGRAGKASGMSIGSFGRLYRRIAGVIPPIVIEGLREVWNLLSRINTVVNIESRINE